ncbi:class I SAM-dependent methyltransferase [Scytonema sp. NUACC21]
MAGFTEPSQYCLSCLKLGLNAQFVIADMAKPLPFQSASFDAVMSNVAIHMFSES